MWKLIFKIPKYIFFDKPKEMHHNVSTLSVNSVNDERWFFTSIDLVFVLVSAQKEANGPVQ